MHGVEPPQKPDAVLQTVAPVDEQVAEHDDLDHLQPPRLTRDPRAKVRRDDYMQPPAEAPEQPDHEPGPQEVLPGEEAEVGEPVRAEKFLPGPRGERELERTEDEHEEEEAQPAGEDDRAD